MTPLVLDVSGLMVERGNLGANASKQDRDGVAR